jgi:hypothetical protein
MNSEATVVDEEAGAVAGGAGSVRDDARIRNATAYLNTTEVNYDEKKRQKKPECRARHTTRCKTARYRTWSSAG